LIRIISDSAGRPAQQRGRPKGKYYLSPADIRFDASAFRGGRQRKIQGTPQNDGTHVVDNILELRAKHLRLKQECRGFGPIANGNADGTAAAGKTVSVDPREGAGAGNACHSCILKNVSLACVERCGADRGFPFAVRRTGNPLIAGNVCRIFDLKRFYRIPDGFGPGRFRGIPDHYARDTNFGFIQCCFDLAVKWGHPNHVQFVAERYVQFKRLEIGMPQNEPNRLS